MFSSTFLLIIGYHHRVIHLHKILKCPCTLCKIINNTLFGFKPGSVYAVSVLLLPQCLPNSFFSFLMHGGGSCCSLRLFGADLMVEAWNLDCLIWRRWEIQLLFHLFWSFIFLLPVSLYITLTLHVLTAFHPQCMLLVFWDARCIISIK